MPFSFKPNQPEGVPGTATTPPPMMATPSSAQVSIGDMSLSERNGGQGPSGLQIALYGIFGITVATALVFGLYDWYLSSQIQSKKDALALYETKLGALPLDAMRKVSNRIKVINQAVAEHASVSTAFRVLEDSVENKVTYTHFDLIRSEATKVYNLQLGVVAPDYKSIAQQLDTFNQNDMYKSFIPVVAYDGINLDNTTGNVTATFKMPIHIEGKIPEAVTFGNTASDTAVPAEATTTISVQATSTQP